MLTLAGWGHTSLFVSSCVDAYVSRYFLTTRVPPRGTVCEPDVVPFAQPAATAQTLQATGAPSKAALVPPAIRGTLTR
ncbi:MAG TPA: alpha/beta hydrolase [Actinomycetota bacterium]|nr:alpha/beta hydrolase [Actinomycetota bacterium]